MSAPTVVDEWALRRGLAWRQTTRDRPQGAKRRRPPHVRERRSKHPVAVLSREHDDLCLQACDPWEIAAGLEAAGLDDRRARRDFGAASVFEVAENLYRLVPRRPPADDASFDPWARPLRTHLLRGVLYALPALVYLAALQATRSDADLAVLTAAVVCSAGAGQVLSVLAHLLLGRLERAAARRLVWFALLGAGAVMALLAAAGPAAGVPRPVAVLAGGQLLYYVAATALMVAHADLLLLLVLAPAATTCAAVLAVPGSLLLERSTWTTLVPAVTVAAAVVAAALCLLGGPAHPPGGGGRLRDLLGRHELAYAGTCGVYGVAAAGMLSFVVLDVLAGHRSPGLLGLAMLPVVLTTGLSEWLLHRLRGQGLRALGTSTRTGEFAVLARRSLALATRLQALGAVVACAAALVAASVLHSGGPGAPLVIDTVTYAVLAVALFLTSALISLALHAVAALASGAALVADLALRALLGSPAHGAALEVAHLAVAVVLVLALFRVVAVHVERPSLHR